MIILKIFYFHWQAECSMPPTRARNNEGKCEREKWKERALHRFMIDKLLIHITVTIFCVYELLIVRQRRFQSDVWRLVWGGNRNESARIVFGLSQMPFIHRRRFKMGDTAI